MKKTRGNAENSPPAPSSEPPVGPAVAFRLPDDWEVEERPRLSNPRHVDRYYYEPKTRLQFRSLLSVQKYLEGEIFDPRTRNGAVLGKKKKIVPFVIKSRPVPELPDGWIVEKIPRSNINYADKIDASYVEPGTGKRFRSLRSAQEYLAKRRMLVTTWKTSKPRNQRTRRRYKCKMNSLELVLKRSSPVERDGATRNGLKRANHNMPSLSFGTRKQLSCKDAKTSTMDSSSVPAKVKWVLNGPAGKRWTPFVDDALVSESEKQKWFEAFVSALNHGP